METIALFGGSFDPPHIGHEAIVKALVNMKEIDKIIVVPTFLNPFKSHSHASPELRLSWIKEVFNEYDKVEISDYEVRQNKSVASILSVKHFLKKYKKIYLVIGADNLESLNKWESYNELKELVTFIVASRNGIEIPKEYITLNIDENISSTQLRRNTLQNRIEKITNSLDKNKAESIEVFDLRNKNYFVEYAIIASSLGAKHTAALLNHLKDDLKPGEKFNNIDESGDWIVIDLGDILIHIMTPEYRVKYDMETFLAGLASGKEGEAL